MKTEKKKEEKKKSQQLNLPHTMNEQDNGGYLMHA